MPGIHFIRSDDSPIRETKLDVLLDSQLHDDDYVREDIYADASCRLSVTRYPQYPVTVFDTQDSLIVLEGRLYGLTDDIIRDDLTTLSGLVFEKDSHIDESVRGWLLGHDGDFTVIMRHKQSDSWAFVNDPLGRLPAYYSRQGNLEVLTREIGLATRLTESPKPDPMGMAQYLLFGFPLGSRMLWRDVERLAPATLMHWGTDAARRSAVHVFDFGNEHAHLSLDSAADTLASQFLAACDSRADMSGHNMLSLSGGLDSRAVAAGLQRAGCHFKAATFGLSSEPPSADLRIARQLAANLDLDWSQIDLPVPGGSDMQRIFRLKDGLINSSQAYDVSYFDQLRSRHGRGLVHFSGDGGDKTLPDLVPQRKFSSHQRLATYILERHRLMEVAQVEQLTGVSVDDITDVLTGLVETYPEASLAKKYVHFMMYERAGHWLFEGEDRNRCAFWSCTPFFHNGFFATAMSCSDHLKKNHRLYREFLRRLSPVATDIVDAGRGLAPSDPTYARRIALATRGARHPRLARLAKSILHRKTAYSDESAIVNCLKEQARSEEVLTETLNGKALQRLVEDPGRISRSAFDNLFALATTVVEHLGRRPSADYLKDNTLL